MSLLVPEMIYFYSKHELSIEKLKQKHRFNFFHRKTFQLPCGIRLSHADPNTREYFSKLKKKFKKGKSPNTPEKDLTQFLEMSLIEEDTFTNWTESKFLNNFIEYGNYFSRPASRLRIKEYPVLSYALHNDPKIQNFAKNFESWISMENNFGLKMNGTLEIKLFDDSVMLAKVYNSRIKEFKLMLKCGFLLIGELGSFQGEEVFKKLQVYFKDGFKYSFFPFNLKDSSANLTKTED